MATRTLRVTDELHSTIQALAKAEGRFMREIVRRSVELYAGLSPTERGALDLPEANRGTTYRLAVLAAGGRQ